MNYNLATIRVLWWRDVVRFWRQPTRVIGALGQPIIFWLVLGGGMAGTFRLQDTGVGYLEYFFPGVIMMVLLFASIFAAVSVIEDRSQGFLQAVIAGPASRSALVAGKCLGSATVAMTQAIMLLALAPFAGINLATTNWPLLLVVMATASIALTGAGFAVAWLLDNVQAYHAIQMTLLLPLWALSGAMFPPHANHPVFAILMYLNPAAYAVSATRHALYGGKAPVGTILSSMPGLEWLAVLGFAVLTMLASVVVCKRR